MITRGFAKSLLGKLARHFVPWVVAGILVFVLGVSWKKLEAPTSLLTPLASETLQGRSSTATPGAGSGLTSTLVSRSTVEPTVAVLVADNPTITSSPMPSWTVSPIPTEPIPTRTQLPTNTSSPIPTDWDGQGAQENATLPTPSRVPTKTPDDVALLQITLEAAKVEREHHAQLLSVQRQLVLWCGLTGIVPLFVVLMAGAFLIVAHIRDEIEEISFEPEYEDGPSVAVGEVGKSDLVSIEVKRGTTTYRYPWPVERRVLRRWSQVALTGGRLGINAWTGDGKPFVREGDGNYGEFLAFWFKTGVLTRSNPDEPNSRILVTDVGEPVLKGYANGDF